MVGRLLTWCKQHLHPGDIVLVLCAMPLLISLGTSIDPAYPGLLRTYGDGTATIWSCLLLIPLMTRRRMPQASALAFVGIVVAHLLLGPSLILSDGFALVLLFTVIAYGDPRHTRSFILLAFVMAVFATTINVWAVNVGALLNQGQGIGAATNGSCSTLYMSGMTAGCSAILLKDWLTLFLLMAVCLVSCIVIGYWQRARIRIVRMLQERNASIEAREAEERRIAMLAERARIARDMHDMVAHTLSIVIVQSDGGRYAAAHNPVLARDTMETIRGEATRALHNMASLLGVLDTTEDAGYEDVDRLVLQARAASPHNTITRTIHGAPRSSALGAATGAALYRVVQEALSNIRKYAGTPVSVHIREEWDPQGLHLTIRDNGQGSAAANDAHTPGFGLMGMRERVTAAHGSMSAGPCDHGGFLVSVEVPYTTSAPAWGAAAASTADSDIATTATTGAEAGTNAATRAEAATANGPTRMRAADSANSGNSASTTRIRVVRSGGPAGLNTRVSGRSGDRSSDRVSDKSGGRLHTGASTKATRYDTIDTDAPAAISSWLRMLTYRHRPIPSYADTGTARPTNCVERLSQWAQQHYLAVDTITTMGLIIGFVALNLLVGPTRIDSQLGDTHTPRVLAALASIVTLLPLTLRRYAPELSAACMALLSAFQLFFFGSIGFDDIFVLLSIYSVIMYGSKHARRWVLPAVVANSLLVGITLFVEGKGLHSIAAALLLNRPAAHDRSLGGLLASSIILGTITLVMCVGTIAWALWSRSRGANALVLQLREEALREEQEKQRILAANLERNRISTGIQAEVNATLNGVLNQANAGLQMLELHTMQGDETPPEDIVAAFEQIGSQGRIALAHMRRLLGMLRETGVSDGDDEHQHAMALHPVAAMEDDPVPHD